MRAQVVMPDELEEPQIHVEGTAAYRRNAIVMMLGGIVLILGTGFVWFWTDRLFYVLPFVGLYLIGMGLKRLGSTFKK